MSEAQIVELSQKIDLLSYDETLSAISMLLERLKTAFPNKQSFVHSKSAKGIAHKYANPVLIPQEENVAAKAFSGE
ncbi:hypothetical protein [Treponema sp. UBA7567]|uniref:hypothetical protein n=1 Tax=Treponema sp. UBA7567 TaxID=1947748 RepID=UPI0025E2E526|nr:hypothetical protein [Treponema sp. UBA7567]